MSEQTVEQAIEQVNSVLAFGSIKVNGEALTRADHLALAKAMAVIEATVAEAGTVRKPPVKSK